MIASLKGIVESVGEDWAVVDVGGVGYLVFCSSRTLAALPGLGESVSLHVETQVREDHIHLYGFGSTAERSWFRLLVTVQGVGARVAMALLSALTATELSGAIAAGDRAALCRASGVGPRLAQRILTELRDKVDDLPLGTAMERSLGGRRGAPVPATGEDDAAVLRDAVSALVNLGYGRTEAFSAVMEASRELGSEARLEALIRAGLLRLGAAA